MEKYLDIIPRCNNIVIAVLTIHLKSFWINLLLYCINGSPTWNSIYRQGLACPAKGYEFYRHLKIMKTYFKHINS